MLLREVAESLIADPKKLINYSLNLENPVGGDKARVFQSALGFNQQNYRLLLEQIEAIAPGVEAISTRLDEHGQRYQVDFEVVGIEVNQCEMIRTGWIVKPGQGIARLITLYVLRRKK